MSFKGKIMNIITTHPKLVTFGIGFAITFAALTALSVLSTAYAAKPDFCCDQ
jgi:hypothetical protein